MLEDLYFLLKTLKGSLIDLSYLNNYNYIVPKSGPQILVSNPLLKSLANNTIY